MAIIFLIEAKVLKNIMLFTGICYFKLFKINSIYVAILYAITEKIGTINTGGKPKICYFC